MDGQISALQARLQDSSDEELKEIAEFGMNGVVGNHRARLMAALLEIDGGDPAAMRSTSPKALELISVFRTYLATSEQVEVCDRNPLDTPASIEATLDGALSEMSAALEVFSALGGQGRRHDAGAGGS